MQGREQIGPPGLWALMFGFLVGSTLVLPMGAQAKQDSWLAMLLGGSAGLLVAWLYTTLAQLFPGHSLISYSKILFGRWLGGLVGLAYIWYGLHLGALVLRNFGEFLIVTLLPVTPISVIALMLMVLCAYSVRHGLEPLSRSCQVLVAVVMFQVLLASALLLKDARLENLLPVLEHGPVPVLQAAFTVLGFPFGETVLFALILPFVCPKGAIKRSVMLPMATAILFLVMVHARNVAVLGAHLVVTSRFPTFDVTKQIDIADFLTRLDALIITNWVTAGFIKVSICLYATATGLAEWAGVSDYKPLVLPLGVIMVVFSFMAYQNISEMATFAATIWPVYSVPFQILMPVLLLGTAWMRGKFGS